MPSWSWFVDKPQFRGHVKDQENTLYCWAIAIAFVVGTRNVIDNNIKSLRWMLSAQDLIDNVIRDYHSDLPEGSLSTEDTSYSAFAETGLKYCTYKGLAYESDYPYTGRRDTGSGKKPVTSNRVYISGFNALGCSSEGPQIKDNIFGAVRRGPVIGTIQTSRNFSLWKGDTIIDDHPVAGPVVTGEHAVAIAGMDTDADFYEIQNSEGEKWAVEGVGRILCDLVYDILEPIGPRSTPYYPTNSSEEANEEFSEESKESEESADEEWGKPPKRQRKNQNILLGRALKETQHGKKPPGVRKTLLEVTFQAKSSLSLQSNLDKFYTRGLVAQLAHDVPFSAICRRTLKHVLISPKVSSCGVNCALIEKLAKLCRRSHLWKHFPEYDGRKNFYTAGSLTLVKEEFKIVLPDENDGLGSTSLICRRERDFKVVIKFASGADLRHLQMLIEGNWADTPQGALQVVDIVQGEWPTARCFPAGQSFYYPHIRPRRLLDEGLESWRGFYQRIRPTQMGLSLNSDMSSTVFTEPLLVNEFAPQRLNRDVTFVPLSVADCLKVKNSLKGVRVEVLHSETMCRKYCISDLTSQPTRELMFPDDERDTMKGVIEYVWNTSDVVLKHIQLPCLQVRTQPRSINLPMEVCKIVVGQRYVKRSNEKQITALFKDTCLS